MTVDKKQEIARPRQLYIGEGEWGYDDRFRETFPDPRIDSIRT